MSDRMERADREQAEKLLGGYATNTLTKTEREILMRAALEDADVFEQLADEEDMRGALDDDEFRGELRNRLIELQASERRPWYSFITAIRPQWLWALSAGAALAVVLMIRQGTISENSPIARVVLGPGTIPALHAAGLLEEPAPQEKKLVEQIRSAPPKKGGGTLALDRRGSNPVYSIGDRQRIGLSVVHDSNALLTEQQPDGSMVRLFPNRFQSSVAVAANQTILIPPAGQGDLGVEGPPGKRILRLLIFPPNVDPLAQGADWERLRQQASVIEKQYEVRP